MNELVVQTAEYFAELLVNTTNEDTTTELEVQTDEYFAELLVDVS